MERKIFFRPDRCMLCQSCVLACQMSSLGVSNVIDLPSHRRPQKRLSLVFRNGTPWIWKCQHCLSAPCVEACISGSLSRKEGTSRVIHQPETCVGCGTCLLVCPYEALVYDEKEEKVSKCNLCPDEEIPPCVEACQSKALTYSETDSFVREKKKRFAQEGRRVRERE